MALFYSGNNKAENSLLHLSAEQRDEMRMKLFNALTRYKSVKVISVVADTARAYKDPTIKDEEGLYQRAYKVLTERFQYFLQDLERESGQHIKGIIVCDHRNRHQDERLRVLHQKLVNTQDIFTSFYANIIEGLFLAPSHYSVGIQFADLVAGAVYRKYESGDERFYEKIKPLIRTSQKGAISGFGIIIIPKG